MAPQKSKIKGRVSKKLDELIQLLSTLNDNLQSQLKKQSQKLTKQSQQLKKQRQQLKKQSQKLKKQRQQNQHSSKLTKELYEFIMKDQGSLVIDNAESCVERRRFELSFVCALPRRLFTASIIYAIDDGTVTNVPVRVVLLDEGRKVVNDDGPLSSLEIEIVVACGDLKAEKSEDWTGKEIETSRLRAREEKGTLLVGSCLGTMQNGVCSFNDLKFVDNSSWVPSKTFKLVAKVVESAKVPKHVQVRPAVSGAFQVMDQRGKHYEKHSVPSWDGEVWRLKKIRKNGPYHKNLEAQGIRTVMDFRRRYSIDQSSLRKILGAKDGVWATMVQHANECCPNSELFRYDSEEGVELLFDCFYQLIGVSFDHQNDRSLRTLNELEKNLVEQLRRRAFEDHSKLIQVNSLSTWPSTNARPCILPDPNPQHPPPHQDAGASTLNEFVFECEHFPQSPLWFSAENMHQLEEPTAQRIADIEGFGAVESGCILYDSLNITDQHRP